jgi:hypothetical protein
LILSNWIKTIRQIEEKIVVRDMRGESFIKFMILIVDDQII